MVEQFPRVLRYGKLPSCNTCIYFRHQACAREGVARVLVKERQDIAINRVTPDDVCYAWQGFTEQVEVTVESGRVIRAERQDLNKLSSYESAMYTAGLGDPGVRDQVILWLERTREIDVG